MPKENAGSITPSNFKICFKDTGKEQHDTDIKVNPQNNRAGKVAQNHTALILNTDMNTC